MGWQSSHRRQAVPISVKRGAAHTRKRLPMAASTSSESQYPLTIRISVSLHDPNLSIRPRSNSQYPFKIPTSVFLQDPNLSILPRFQHQYFFKIRISVSRQHPGLRTTSRSERRFSHHPLKAQISEYAHQNLSDN